MDALTFLPALFGYIDPGTGSLVIQVLAATLLSAGLFFKGLREKITMLLASIFRNKSSALESESAEPTVVAGKITPRSATGAARKAA